MKILYISYNWPPNNEAGTYRVLTVCNFLAAQGYDVTVLTTDKFYDAPIDNDLTSQIDPRISVVKLINTPPISAYFFSRKNFLLKLLGICFGKMEKRFYFPDQKKTWRIAALKKGKQLVKEKGINIVYSSSPYFSCGYIGLRLKQLFGDRIRLITEFRDLISSQVRMGNVKSDRKKIDFESSLVSDSDLVIVDSSHKKKYLAETHKLTLSQDSKIHCVYSGFPRSMLSASSRKGGKYPKIIRYIGGLRGLSIIPGFESVLVECAKKYQNEIVFEFIGSADHKFKSKVLSKVLSIGLSNIKFIDFVSQKEAERFVVTADALLLLIDNIPNSNILTSIKIFRYIASFNPILAIIPSRGSAADIIRETKTGLIFDPAHNDWAEKFIDAVGELCKQPSFRLNPDRKAVEKYSSENQLLKIKELIEGMFI